MTTKNLNIRVSDEEWKILNAYAKRKVNTKTNILREFIRSLDSKP